MTTSVSEDVYNDTLIDDFMKKYTILDNSKQLMVDIIRKPIYNIEELRKRQNLLNMPDITIQLNHLKNLEEDVLYFINLNCKDVNSDNEFLSALFPNNWYSFPINLTYPTLELFHLYKVYSVPLMQFISPVSIILGPYYYIKQVLKIDFSLFKYVSILWKSLKAIMSASYSDIKYSLVKWITILIYFSLYIFGLWQMVDYSYYLHKLRNDLSTKISNVKSFITICSKLFENIPDEYWKLNDIYYDKSFIINGDLTDVYSFWTNTSNYRLRMKQIMECINYMDIANVISKLYHNDNWCKVDYNSTSNTTIVGMRSPLLNEDQVCNPAYLKNHLIITGPNAGGKTTYVKNIVLNIILSQTIGIAMANKMITNTYHIIQTFMRVSDEVGTRSYFETEVKYCYDLLDKAEKNKDQNILFVMDEPMHSTPPIEGQSTAYAVCEYINNNFKNAKLIVTTHYHSLIDLGYTYKDNFTNLSMEAIEESEYNFKFPYRIKNKESKQCIALELLGREMFPEELIKSAIKMKNRLSNVDDK